MKWVKSIERKRFNRFILFDETGKQVGLIQEFDPKDGWEVIYDSRRYERYDTYENAVKGLEKLHATPEAIKATWKSPYHGKGCCQSVDYGSNGGGLF